MKTHSTTDTMASNNSGYESNESRETIIDVGLITTQIECLPQKVVELFVTHDVSSEWEKEENEN